MRKKLLILALIISLLCPFLGGCSTTKATVVTTVYPVKYLLDKLAGDKVDSAYLSTDEFIQCAKVVDNMDNILKDADLLIYIGGLEPYMDMYSKDIQAYDNLELINLASLSAIDNFSRYTTNVVNGVKHTIESLYYDSPLFANVDVYDKDPFIWLDPIGMSSMASTIKNWLQERYPEDSLYFENNFKALQADFVRMDAEYQNLNSINDIKLVTVTASFGNWQKAYNVEVYPLILSKYGAIPTDEQLEYIEQQIQANGVKYIVADDTLPLEMQQLYEKVKTDLELEEICLSSLSKLSAEDIQMDKDYKTIMYENLTALEKAFK